MQVQLFLNEKEKKKRGPWKIYYAHCFCFYKTNVNYFKKEQNPCKIHYALK